MRKLLVLFLLCALLVPAFGQSVQHQGLLGTAKPAAGGAFSPSNVSNLLVWLKADAGITLDNTGYSGTGTISQSGITVTGSGTAFVSEVAIGDVITATGISGTVTGIPNDGLIQLNNSATGAGGAFTITPQAGTTDRVSAWADQSGNANNASQATAKKRPLKALNAQNSLPGVFANPNGFINAQFNQFMETGSIANGIGTGDFYIIVAAIRNADVGTYQAICNPSNLSPLFGGPYWETSAGDNFGAWYGAAHSFTGSASRLTPYIIEFWRASGVLHLRINNSDDATTLSTSSSIPTGNFELFSDDADSDCSSAYTLEVCFYGTLPSSTNRDNLHNYMNTRWAVH